MTAILKVLSILTLVASLALAAPRRVVGDTGCVGDCGQDAEVTVDELLKMVNIALGSSAVSDCVAGDQNGDGSVTIDEILRAVNNALTGCPVAGATATPTPTPTPPATSGGSTSAVAGRSVIVVNTLSTISQIVSAVINGLQVGSSLTLSPDIEADETNGGGAGSCPFGGTATSTGNILNKQITLTGCKVQTVDGSVTFDGTINTSFTSFNLDVTANFADQIGTQTVLAHAVLSGSISPSLGGNCYLTAATFTLSSGSLMTTRGGVTVGVTFQNTTMSITNITFNSSCSPIKYLLTFNGPAVLIDPAGMLTNVAFNALTMDVDDSASQTVLVVGGGMTSACFGAPVTLMTSPPLTVQRGQNCPNDGTITISAQGQVVGRSIFNSDESVGLDQDGNGSVDETVPNCLDPRLLICAG